MQEQWQLYDQQGRVLIGKGADRVEIFSKGLLHGASHIWIWRQKSDLVEVLLQKRASHKMTFANLYDISAAGHIDLGEQPLAAALRETKEEIGIDVVEDSLRLISVFRSTLIADNKAIENEFQWVYLIEINDDLNFTLQHSEVKSLEWISLDKFKKEVSDNHQKSYVPHGVRYFETVIDSIEFDLTNH
jgi:isopentenyldiphosphate isomerase